MTAAAPSLRRGVFQVLLGNGFFNVCRLVAAPILIAKCASSAVLGQYEYGMALASPIVLLFSLELRSIYVSDTARQFPFAAYRALRTIGLALATVVLAMLVAWRSLGGRIPFFDSDAAFEPGTDASAFSPLAMVLILAGACALRISFQSAEIYWGVYQRRERLDLLAWSNALRGLLMLVIFAGCLIPVMSGGQDAGRTQMTALAVWLTVLAWSCIGWMWDRRHTRQNDEPASAWSWADVTSLARVALPLGLVALLISLAENVPRWFIRDGEDGLRSLGRFGALAYLPMAAHFVVLQIAVAASNRLALGFRDDRRAFLRLGFALIGISIALGTVVFVGVWLIGPALLRVAYTAEYAEHYPAFLVLVGAQCVLLPGSVLGYVLTQMRLFWPQAGLHAIVLLATLVSAALFLPGEPVYGGAETMFVRACVQTALYAGCFAIAMLATKRWPRV